MTAEPFTNTPAGWAEVCLAFVGENIARIPGVHPSGALNESLRAAELASVLLDIQVKLDGRDYTAPVEPTVGRDLRVELQRRLDNIERFVDHELLINTEGSTLRGVGERLSALAHGGDYDDESDDQTHPYDPDVARDERIAGYPW